jgi:hypothetical protein
VQCTGTHHFCNSFMESLPQFLHSFLSPGFPANSVQ